MAQTPKFSGTIKNGVFIPNDAELRKRYLAGFEGRAVEEVIRKAQKAGSDKQRKYYFAVIVKEMCDFSSGYGRKSKHEIDGMHLSLKLKFASEYDEDLKLTRIESYADMTVERREEYHEDIRRWAATEFFINIPSPSQTDWL